MKSKILMLISLCLLTIGSALGQTITVKGIVTDERGDGVIGATVRLKSDATVGTMTGMDGDFTLKAKQGELIIVSYVGYKTQEVAAAPNLNIKLVPDTELLDDVVVIGYGTRKVANTSASVVKINSKELQAKPTANIMDAVQGKVAGVKVLTSSGEPSERASINFHGKGSLGSDTTPLYILDGVPVSDGLIQSLNPNDFESMQFLKDAAATSIYGARAANGVIYITTKRGVARERAQISVRTQYGISDLANPGYYKKLMNTNELFSFWEESGIKSKDEVADLRKTYGNNNTEWWKYYYQSAPSFQSDINVSGGAGRTNYYFSAGYLSQKGIRAGSSYDKINMRLNLNSSLNDYIKMGINSSVSYDKARISPKSYASKETYVSLATLINPPYITPYKEDGSEYFDEPIPGLGAYNPKYHMTKDIPFDKTLYMNVVGNITITPFKNFQLRSMVGVEVADYTRDRLRLPSWKKLAGNGTNSKQFSRDVLFSTNNVAEYKFSVADDHHFITLAGHEYINSKYNFFSALGSGINDDRLTELQFATKDKTIESKTKEYAFLSFFGQFSYDYQEKYFLDLVLRNDASSRFSEKHRNAMFWSAGLLWKAKKEDFLANVDWLNSLDFKASYGTQGNANIGNYESYATVGDGGKYMNNPGWKIAKAGNDELTWESQDKLTVGVAATLFDRLSIDFEFYNRLTRNMLMDVPQPYTSGLKLDDMDFASIKQNVGSYQNRGVDIKITGDIVRGKDYGVSGYFNFNYNADKIVKLFQGRDEWILPGYGFGYVVGQPVNFMYPIFKDIDPKTGDPRWYLPKLDKDGNPIKGINNMNDNEVTSDFDESFLEQNTGKHRYPPITGGFGFSANWRGLSLDADFAFVLGKWMIANETYFTKNPVAFAGMNTEKDSRNYWKQEGDNARYPSMKYQLATGTATKFDSSLLSDASFMRLKNLTIGYTFQKKLLEKQNVITGLKVYGTARNLLTFTKFEGIDPEVDSNLSFHTNPNTRQFVLGLEVSF
ncbi:SusC/RagA family TonB-linked outer membrane protein [Porphyromonas sp. HMSC077F02]|uniref:SusC/RagA family TonB-linked outer membrane protein n=1 Tax=Porphyromonas sp. HMSC077F02 TaxID=1739529 RepID=UPI0008A1A346|nr:SusC/RagA family TonB-linked outer membrane protein [Porphyromonas sp. HMSC077F02]